MNKPDTKLDECIFIAQKIIPADLCDAVIKDIEIREWEPHKWYTSSTDSTHSIDRELDIQLTTIELQKELSPFIIEAARQYTRIYSYDYKHTTRQFMSQFSPIRFNRYSPGQIMRQHHDHIRSLFDGKLKGVPVLTFILNFNDNYEGADLFFWEDTIFKLGKGDIIMFPSNWLFPHGVTEATKGVRYSGSVWGW